MSDAKICRHCKQPVVVNADNYGIFEDMHWLCFHLSYEHHADPDEKCDDPSCPWWHMEVMQNKLKELGCDPQVVMDEAITERWKLEDKT